jgi:plasmid stabilization system protein ParE
MSFRWFASRFVPRANPRKQAVLGVALLLAAGCGGGGGRPTDEKLVRGPGFVFSAPAAWAVSGSGREVRVSQGLAVLSVTRFPLVRAFRPELWDKVVPELDRAAAQLAEQQDGTVGDPETVTIAERRARRYDVFYEGNGKRLVERIAFVLRGKTEYLLLCRYVLGGETRACDRLLATFRLT